MSVVALRYKEIADRYNVAPGSLPAVGRERERSRGRESNLMRHSSPVPVHASGFRARSLTSPTPSRNIFSPVTTRSRQVRSAYPRRLLGDTFVSGSAAPQTQKPKTAGPLGLRRRQELRKSSLSLADAGSDRKTKRPDAHVLQPQVRYDPAVVGEVGPERSLTPKRSVHLQQSLNTIPDADVIKELMTSFQVRPISGTLSVKTDSTLIKRNRTWPTIQASRSSRIQAFSRQNQEEGQGRDKNNVVWAPDIERVRDVKGAISPSVLSDFSEESVEENGAETTFEKASGWNLTAQPTTQVINKASPPEVKSYDMGRQRVNRNTFPVCRIGLIDKTSRDSPQQVFSPAPQSLSPYLPNYRPVGGRSQRSPRRQKNTVGDNRPMMVRDITRDTSPSGHIPSPPSRMTVMSARSRPHTGAQRRPSTRAGRPQTSKYRADKYSRPEGSLYVRVSVQDVDMPHPVSGTSWLRAYQNKELIFYTAVLRDESIYIEQFSALPDLADIEIKTLSVGSLVIQMQCRTPSALQRLEKLYRKRFLNKIVNQVLANAELMEEMGVQNLILDTIIEPADFERCKRELTIVDIDNAIKQEPGLNLEEREVKEPNFMSRIDCATSFQNVLEDFKTHIASLDGRHQHISAHRKDFLMTLKLVKPVDIKVFRTLGDVISVHRYLRASPSVGKTVQTDLVTDFLSIVNLSRLKLSDLLTKVKSFEGHALKYADFALLDSIYQTIDDVNRVLDPSFNFVDIPLDGGVDLGIMDSKLFSNLVLYTPYLFQKLGTVTAALQSATDTLSMTPSSNGGKTTCELVLQSTPEPLSRDSSLNKEFVPDSKTYIPTTDIN